MLPDDDPGLRGPKTPLATSIAAFRTSKSKAQGGGAYATSAGRVLDRFSSWASRRGVGVVGDVDAHVCASYAAHLKQRVQADAIAPTTAHTYYDTVSAWLSWCVARELLDSNPAMKYVARDELPDAEQSATQQFWSPETREAIVRWADWRAADAREHGWMDSAQAARDRALVAVLAYAGVRTAEVLRDPRDDRREGLRWRDVDIDGGTLRVLGKSQEREHAQLPPQAARRLATYKGLRPPGSDDWPVFATNHAPSIYAAVRTALRERGIDDEEIERRLDENPIETVLRDHDVAPPALSVRGGRHVIRTLSSESGITEDGDYLEPHGARRGLGDTLYRRSSELAQVALRHKSVETTHAAYSHIEASETSESVGRILDDDGQ